MIKKRQGKNYTTEYFEHLSDPLLDIDVFSITDFAETERGMQKIQELQSCNRLPRRFEFYILILLTQGTLKQRIDFQDIEQQADELVLIHPKQMHQAFNISDSLHMTEGFVITFRPELLLPSSAITLESYHKFIQDIQNLPKKQRLGEEIFTLCESVMQRMRTFLQLPTDAQNLNALLRLQLYTLLSLLIINKQQSTPDAHPNLSKGHKRYLLFKEMISQHHQQEHQLSFYAKQLSTTEKSLSRSCIEAEGQNAKKVILNHLSLEAKRLLAYTDLSVKQIAGQLGFDEVTNFSKFFKRETGYTPSSFRQTETTTKNIFR